MSYAQVTAKGPKQSPEEVAHTDASTESLVDVDSVHVSTVPSDFETQSIKTDTQADRIQREAEDEQRELEAEYEEVKRQAKREAKEKAQQVKEEAHRAEEKAQELKAKAEAEAKRKIGKVSKVAKSTGHDLHENADNPVIVGNAVVVAVLSAALGFGAYRKYAAGELTWKVVGAWVGVVGLFAAGDYYLSQ